MHLFHCCSLFLQTFWRNTKEQWPKTMLHQKQNRKNKRKKSAINKSLNSVGIEFPTQSLSHIILTTEMWTTKRFIELSRVIEFNEFIEFSVCWENTPTVLALSVDFDSYLWSKHIVVKIWNLFFNKTIKTTEFVCYEQPFTSTYSSFGHGLLAKAFPYGQCKLHKQRL